MYENRTLVRGDNLEEMRKFPDDCIDLIATDPPFNSKRNYFVPYRDQHGQEPDTLIRAFTDTWDMGRSRRGCIPAFTRRGRRTDRQYHSRTTPVPQRNADDGIPRHDGYQDRRNAPDPQTHRESIPPLRFNS